MGLARKERTSAAAVLVEGVRGEVVARNGSEWVADGESEQRVAELRGG